MIVYYIDAPTLLLLVLLNVAAVLLSGKRSYIEVLEILENVSIPSGVLVAIISTVIVLTQVENLSMIGVNLSVCMISIGYALIEYIIVFVLRQRA